MTTLQALVDLARSSTQAPDDDALRTRLLHNCAAAAGEQFESGPIARALTGDHGPGLVALHLAARMHARTQDDFYPAGRVHVGTVVIPVVLALVPDRPLPALAAGYEVLTAVASAYSGIAQQRGYRPTGIFGPVGAAATAGVALELDDDQLASALALASAMSAGTNQSWVDGSDEWLVEVALASRAGLEAAQLAAAGVRGAPNAFDGPSGWSSAYFDDDGAHRLNAVLAGTSRRTADVAIKPYPVSGIAQVPTHLAARLGGAFDHREPERIEVRMSSGELSYPGSRNRGPFKSRSDSLMSVARCVALAYLHGAVPYRQLVRPPGDREQSVLDVIELVTDDGLQETEAILTAAVAGQERAERGSGGEILYPDWQATTRDLSGIAARSEARPEIVSKLHRAIEQGSEIGVINDLLEETA